MNVLIVGGGAREHALAWKLRRSPLVTDLFAAPGNAGTAAVAENLSLSERNFEAIVAAARLYRIDLVVVGPEAPLAGGLVDLLAHHGFAAFGPSQAAARIESSKGWAKQLMQTHGVPTAAFTIVGDLDQARRAVLNAVEPPVVKADGLAAGKGVVVATSHAEALQAVEQALGGAFGEAGRTLVLEARLNGREVSAHAICDGRRALLLPFACDAKRVFDADQGPNTGGMGAYSPPGFIGSQLGEDILRNVVEPVLAAMAIGGSPFRGTLYPGLMVTPDGPRVVEFNARFGDPETQVLLPRLATDLLPLLMGAAAGELPEATPAWSENASVGVVLASQGYPGRHEIGKEISGLATIDDDVQVFHAATRLSGGRTVTSGGRVLTVVGHGATIAQARQRAYANAARIRFDGVHYRTDIGLREVTPTLPRSGAG